MKIRIHILLFLLLGAFLACENSENESDILYSCLGDAGGCVESIYGNFETLYDCQLVCQPKPNNTETRITVFLFENCPIAQYMCGPLRETYRYFCDTLNQNMIFRGFSPNSFSTEESLAEFVLEYDIPFPVTRDYNDTENTPGAHTQQYLPIVTPEVFIEFNGELIYKGMIDNSYLELGNWSSPTENYLLDILTNIVNEGEIVYFETEAVGCLINY